MYDDISISIYRYYVVLGAGVLSIDWMRLRHNAQTLSNSVVLALVTHSPTSIKLQLTLCFTNFRDDLLRLLLLRIDVTTTAIFTSPTQPDSLATRKAQRDSTDTVSRYAPDMLGWLIHLNTPGE